MTEPAAPITEAEWAAHRAAALALPPVGDADAVLLPYQRDLLAALAEHEVVVFEKSRRIGATWGVGAQAVLTAALRRDQGGMDVLYIGYALDMTREFIDVCAMWARAFHGAAPEVGETLFRETDEAGADRAIQAFRIRFASGFEVLALTSRPRSLRGRQGFVIIDEAAYHDDLPGLLKSALALLMWGGRVLVVSTHDGAENPFNELILEARAGKKPFRVLRTTFDEAVEQGLYQRIALVKGLDASAVAEAAWRARMRAFYGAAAEEELDVIPSQGTARYLPLHLIEARASRDIPVLRWRCDDAFIHRAEDVRDRAARAWCETEIAPLLPRLDKLLRKAMGVDFARSGDLTVFWPLVIQPDLTRRTPFIVELRNVPFEQQRQILHWLLSRMTLLGGVAMDATGNGSWLAEATLVRFGAHRVEPIHLTEGWYRDHMPKLKAAFEDASLDIPADERVVGDFRLITLVRGVPRIPEKRQAAKGEDRAAEKAQGGQRHGDAAIAAALAVYAAIKDTGDATGDAVPLADQVGGRGLADFVGAGLRRFGLGDFLGMGR